MAKFRVGDRIKVITHNIDCENGLKIGSIGTVLIVGPQLFIEFDNYKNSYILEDYPDCEAGWYMGKEYVQLYPSRTKEEEVIYKINEMHSRWINRHIAEESPQW